MLNPICGEFAGARPASFLAALDKQADERHDFGRSPLLAEELPAGALGR
jgi:hypothetical protein